MNADPRRKNMFYTKLGRIVAALSFGLGLFVIVVATTVAVQTSEVATLGTKTTGQWIDRGIYMAVFGIIVGVLTDISDSVAELRIKVALTRVLALLAAHREELGIMTMFHVPACFHLRRETRSPPNSPKS